MTEETAVQVESAPTPEVDPTAFTGDERHQWRMTGKLPEVKPKVEESAPPKETSATEEEKTEVETAPESETGKKQEQRHTGTPAPKREKQLGEDIQELLAKRAQLRSEVEQLEQKRTPAKQESAPAAPQTQSTRPEPTIDDKDEKGEPKYQTWDAYMADVRKWDREQAVAEFERKQALAEAQKSVNQKMAEGRERYGEGFDQAVVPATREIMQDQGIHPAVKGILNQSPFYTDILYVLGTDKKAMADIVQTAKADPVAAIRKLVLLEIEVSKELVKPQTEKTVPPAKKTSQAPNPPVEVTGRGVTGGDEVDQALKDGDQDSYSRAMNARDLARRKGK